MKLSVKLIFLFITLFSLNSSFACTRVLMVDNQHSVLVGRTMDWIEDMKTNLWLFPRGMTRNGMSGDKNSLEWTSKYGSIVATGYDIAAADGMNEKGLASHVLWLRESDYGKRDANIPGMSIILWAQFYLDNFATVDEAVRFTQTSAFQLVPFYHPPTKKWLQIHLALDDASGDSAIIEYENGVPHVYHGAYKVLTNSPTLNKQLENLKQYQGFGGTKLLPGTTQSEDRFVRASYYLTKISGASSARNEFTKVMSIIDNIAEPDAPLGSDDANPYFGPTIWRVVADLSERVYYFKSAASLNMVWAKLSDFNLAAGAPVMKLDLVNQADLSGDMKSEFHPVFH